MTNTEKAKAFLDGFKKYVKTDWDGSYQEVTLKIKDFNALAALARHSVEFRAHGLECYREGSTDCEELGIQKSGMCSPCKNRLDYQATVDSLPEGD